MLAFFVNLGDHNGGKILRNICFFLLFFSTIVAVEFEKNVCIFCQLW